MLLLLFWLFLAFCYSPSLLANTDHAFFQSPPAIVLSHLNGTAELHCSTTSLQAIGLYLKQRYSKPRELLYVNIGDLIKTPHQDFKHRLEVTGHCCNFTFHLSQLQTEDTNGYYCDWLFVGTNLELNYRHANETVIIVREDDPEEDCNKRRMAHRILLIISVAITIIMFFICVGVITWRFRESYQH